MSTPPDWFGGAASQPLPPAVPQQTPGWGEPTSPADAQTWWPIPQVAQQPVAPAYPAQPYPAQPYDYNQQQQGGWPAGYAPQTQPIQQVQQVPHKRPGRITAAAIMAMVEAFIAMEGIALIATQPLLGFLMVGAGGLLGVGGYRLIRDRDARPVIIGAAIYVLAILVEIMSTPTGGAAILGLLIPGLILRFVLHSDSAQWFASRGVATFSASDITDRFKQK